MARKAVPNMAREIGFDHGLMAGTVIERQKVFNWSPGWFASEVDAYIDGRQKGVIEKLSRLAGLP